ncbi:MAG: ABC transporter ATP-binding protein [Ruminococcaceae bacterium]|nr:ABC transporter ATP-binding protein [Oscillospiraceae bacterium]
MTVFSCEALIKQYKLSDHVVTAVNRATFSVEKGEFVAIMGESGSGKSTLLNLCAGLDRPESGSVTLLGKSLFQMKPDELCRFRGKHMGIVFQDHRLVPYLTALENILLPLSAAGRDISGYKTRLEYLINRLSLGDRLHHLPRELSGGQQQRVALARALIHFPMILFADEPTGNLDRESADHVAELLTELQKEEGESQATIVVTHDERLAAHAHRVLIMKDGELTPAK